MVKKDGTQNGKQRYKCKQCLKRFIHNSKPNIQQIWLEYTDNKQTLEQLSKRYKRSIRTIQRYIDKAKPQDIKFTIPKRANVIMDTTYFRRNYGIMVLYDAITQRVLLVQEVKYETNQLYKSAIEQLQTQGVEIQSIICDGRKGLLKQFTDIPVQLCQFHQVKTVNRYLTRNPKSVAGLALKELVLTLKTAKKEQFKKGLEMWYQTHKTYLNERSLNEKTGKLSYTHRRLRSAYLSLKRNLNHLFVFEEYEECRIPKTTNLLEAVFGDMKRKLACHNGLKKESKILFIKDFLSKKGAN